MARMGRKRRRLELEEARAETAKLHRRGYTQLEISKILNVSIATVCKDLKRIQREYTHQIQDNTKRHEEELAIHVQEKLKQYRQVMREAWEAWEKSKDEWSTEVHEEKSVSHGGGKGTHINKTVTTTGRNRPGNEYLVTIMQCLEAERKLLGIDPAQKVDVRAQVLNWDALVSELEDGKSSQDEIEAKIQAVLNPVVVQQLEHKETQSTSNGHTDNGTDTGPG